MSTPAYTYIHTSGGLISAVSKELITNRSDLLSLPRWCKMRKIRIYNRTEGGNDATNATRTQNRPGAQHAPSD